MRVSHASNRFLLAVFTLVCCYSTLIANDKFAESRDQILRGLLDEPALPESQVFRAKGSDAQGSTASVNLRIRFDHGSAQLKPESMSLLNELGAALMNPRIRNRRVTLIGHTDATGTVAYNLTLSQHRAEAVKAYLVDTLELEPERFDWLGKGESEPLNNNATTIQREVNRRVEISLLP